MADDKSLTKTKKPPTETAMCACPGCGRQAIESTAGDPTADSFVLDTSEGDAAFGRKALTNDGKSLPHVLPKHEVAHDPLNHCWTHRAWIGTPHARQVAVLKGV